MSQPRSDKLLIISKRLLIFAAISLIATTILFGITWFFHTRLFISWLVFECGIIGGFVSIQQRLRKIDDEELNILSTSWATILVIPIYGGIFSLVLYMIFLGGLIQGDLFPKFFVPNFNSPPTTHDVVSFLSKTYPKQGSDIAKLIFWSFSAGFSERLVPQIIQNTTSKVD